ncbi:MAG: PD40 domain-containing protein [Planctomycetaceae bacterium]|nr:PD40 domain-containing protein [Planctomycetaceae bacterium]MCB9954073.1 PD40 domain-containing protein [Planctomycetaceae bacterium]
MLLFTRREMAGLYNLGTGESMELKLSSLMFSDRLWICTAVLCVCALAQADDSKPANELSERIKAARQNLDRIYDQLNTDGENGLTLGEFLKRQGPAERSSRDFQVFDFNGDSLISKQELSGIPGVVPLYARGEIPDVFAGIEEHAIASMEISYGWAENPELVIQSNIFATTYLQSLGLNSTQRNQILRQADVNGNLMIDFAEMEGFVKQQLVRRASGVDLHARSGLVVNYSSFLHLDADRDGGISRDEYLSRYYDKELAPGRFQVSDRDGDGTIKLEEFIYPLAFGWNDPINDFLKSDTDLDGELSPEELVEGLPTYLQRIGPFIIPGFDADKNGKLNLWEYRITPVANRVAAWQRVPVDANRNRQIEFAEFAGDESLLLLRRWYFQQFDLDGSGALTPDEYIFKYTPDDAFYALAADDSSFEKLYSSADTSYCGSQAVSPDGKWIAFDGRPAESSFSDTVIYIMAADGTGRRAVCDGSMPTWSADGKYLACSRSGQNSGVWLMKSDGSEPKRISEDGWGAQWSPDGKSIAFTLGAQIALYNVETEAIDVVVGQGGHPYQYIYYNMAWSPDCKRVCFKGRKANDTFELASVSVSGDSPDLKVHYGGELTFDNDAAWSLDGSRIFVSIRNEEKKRSLLYSIAANEENPAPAEVPGQTIDFGTCTSCCWTPDGKSLIVHVRHDALETDLAPIAKTNP